MSQGNEMPTSGLYLLPPPEFVQTVERARLMLIPLEVLRERRYTRADEAEIAAGFTLNI